MAGKGGELLIVEHVKYRNSDSGKSPIGSLHIFKDSVEWRDANSPNRHKILFGNIKAQRVSPAEKSRVQLQICLQDDGQATFVFLRPGADKAGLLRDRDTTKETLQQAVVNHRQRVQQMTVSAEKGSKDAELEAKVKILQQNRQLDQLYKHLVTTNLLTAQDFWTDYYKTTGKSEDRTGMTGAFLANIATSDTDGLKLNLNTNIIQNIFATYPMVERKHLELVPHEMTETEFWVKFATSHYFHREREVLKNPNDPFSDCVKFDEEEIDKLVSGGAKRRRLNFDYLTDNVQSEVNAAQRGECSHAVGTKEKQRETLIRRCNYLSERILETQMHSASAGPSSSSAAAASSSSTGAAAGLNGKAAVNGVNGGEKSRNGYAVLHRWMGDAEDAMESAELQEDEMEIQLQPIKVADGTSVALSEFPSADAARFRSIVCNFLDDVSSTEILDPTDDWLAASPSTSASNHNSPQNRGKKRVLEPATQWGSLTPYVAEIRVVHDAVNELVKHFWTCFPPVTPELEAKIERMEATLKRYEQGPLAESEERFGREPFVHTREMINRVHTRYVQYQARRKK